LGRNTDPYFLLPQKTNTYTTNKYTSFEGEFGGLGVFLCRSMILRVRTSASQIRKIDSRKKI
jgi:hypothetical protein